MSVPALTCTLLLTGSMLPICPNIMSCARAAGSGFGTLEAEDMEEALAAGSSSVSQQPNKGKSSSAHAAHDSQISSSGSSSSSSSSRGSSGAHAAPVEGSTADLNSDATPNEKASGGWDEERELRIAQFWSDAPSNEKASGGGNEEEQQELSTAQVRRMLQAFPLIFGDENKDQMRRMYSCCDILAAKQDEEAHQHKAL
eukprot:1157233-Pelagomonas_calceolata.AAC.7